jgi:hypothetical protein
MRPPKRLREFALLTDERAYRLRAGLTLQEVSTAAGLTLFRASLAERRPDRAKPGELSALRAAVDRLASRGGRGPRFVKLPGAKRPGRGRAGRVIYREANLRPNLGALMVLLPVPCHHRRQRRKDDRRRRFCEIRDRSPMEFCKGVVLHLMQSAIAMGGFWVISKLSDLLLPSEGPLKQVVSAIEGLVLVYLLLIGCKWWNR